MHDGLLFGQVTAFGSTHLGELPILQRPVEVFRECGECEGRDRLAKSPFGKGAKPRADSALQPAKIVVCVVVSRSEHLPLDFVGFEQLGSSAQILRIAKASVDVEDSREENLDERMQWGVRGDLEFDEFEVAWSQTVAKVYIPMPITGGTSKARGCRDLVDPVGTRQADDGFLKGFLCAWIWGGWFGCTPASSIASSRVMACAVLTWKRFASYLRFG